VREGNEHIRLKSKLFNKNHFSISFALLKMKKPKKTLW